MLFLWFLYRYLEVLCRCSHVMIPGKTVFLSFPTMSTFHATLLPFFL